MTTAEAPELPPITGEQRLAVAAWLNERVRPVQHVLAQSTGTELEFEERDYQIDAWIRLEQARVIGRTRALGELAMGLGKTYVAGVDVLRYWEWRNGGSTESGTVPKVLYVSPKHEINDQAAATFRNLMPNNTIGDAQPGEPRAGWDVSFATIQGLYSNLDRYHPRAFSYIIWDESHHLEARTYSRVRDYFEPEFEHALSGTIERMDGRDIRDYFGPPLYKKTLPEGIADGDLADVEYHMVFDSALEARLTRGLWPTTRAGIRALFGAKLPAEELARSIQEQIEALHLRNPRTLMFCSSASEARQMGRLLGGYAYLSSGPQAKKKNKDALQDYRAGNLRLVTARDMFNEGMDVPADLLIFRRVTESGTIFDQQLGRGLRRQVGKDVVYVLDFVANIERIKKVHEFNNRVNEAIERRRNEGAGGGRDRRPGRFVGHARPSQSRVFELHRLAVDVLERWNSLQAEAVPAPEGALSVADFAEVAGVHGVDVRSTARRLGISLPRYDFDGRPGQGLDLETQGIIDPHLEQYRVVIPAPKGALKVVPFARSLGVAPGTVHAVAERIGVKLVKMDFGDRILIGADVAAQEAITEVITKYQEIPDAPADVKSVIAYARSKRMAPATVFGMLEKVGIKPETYKFKNSVGAGLTEAQRDQLETQPLVEIKPAPAGIITGKRDFARELGVSDKFFDGVVDKHKVVLLPCKINGQPTSGLDAELKERVRNLPEIRDRPPKPPQGVVSAIAFSRISGISKHRIARYIADHGITLKPYWFITGSSGGLPHELQETMKHDLGGDSSDE